MSGYDIYRYNVNLIHDTMSRCKNDPYLADCVSYSLSNQDVVLEKDVVPVTEGDERRYCTEVTVSKLRSFEAASKYRGEHVATLNFADWYKPGGEVLSGLTTQEEALCRVSTLYPCIRSEVPMKLFYDSHNDASSSKGNDDLIFTPGVCVFRKDRVPNDVLPQSEWFKTDVITCAAPINWYGDIDDDELSAIHMKRLERMLSVAYSKGVTHLVLGAFGCGAFENDPYVVAEAHRQVLSCWKGRFKVIEYPVYSGKAESKNYVAFNKILGSSF